MSEEIQTASHEVPVEGTDQSIAIPRSDQGTRVVQVIFSRVDAALNVYEGIAGDDIDSFCRRWSDFKRSDDDFLGFVDARSGEIGYIPREQIPFVLAIMIQHLQRELARAPVTAIAIPAPNGVPILRRS